MTNVIGINTGKPVSNMEAVQLDELASSRFWHHVCPVMGIVTMPKICSCRKCGATHYTTPVLTNLPQPADQGTGVPCLSNPTPDDAA